MLWSGRKHEHKGLWSDNYQGHVKGFLPNSLRNCISTEKIPLLFKQLISLCILLQNNVAHEFWVCNGQSGVLREYWAQPTPHQHAPAMVWKWQHGHCLTLFTSFFPMIPFSLFHTWHHGYSVFFRKKWITATIPCTKGWTEREWSLSLSTYTELLCDFMCYMYQLCTLRIKSWQDNRLNSVIISHTEYSFTPVEMARLRYRICITYSFLS